MSWRRWLRRLIGAALIVYVAICAFLYFAQARLLFRHPLNSVQALAARRLPVAIVAGGSDKLVRPERTQGLRRAVANLVFDRTIPGAGHNSIYRDAAFDPAMNAAMNEVLGGANQALEPQPFRTSRGCSGCRRR